MMLLAPIMVNRAMQKLKNWRVSEGLTQAQAGRRFGVTRMTWFRWENGDFPPRRGLIEDLCREVEGLQPNDFYALPAVQPERKAA